MALLVGADAMHPKSRDDGRAGTAPSAASSLQGLQLQGHVLAGCINAEAPHGGTLTTPNGREISELVPVVTPLTIRKRERLEEPSAALLHSNYVHHSATKPHVMPCGWKGSVTIWRRTFGSHARSAATKKRSAGDPQRSCRGSYSRNRRYKDQRLMPNSPAILAFASPASTRLRTSSICSGCRDRVASSVDASLLRKGDLLTLPFSNESALEFGHGSHD